MPYAIRLIDMDGEPRWFQPLAGHREEYGTFTRANKTANRMNRRYGAEIYEAVTLDDELALANEAEWDALSQLTARRG